MTVIEIKQTELKWQFWYVIEQFSRNMTAVMTNFYIVIWADRNKLSFEAKISPNS